MLCAFERGLEMSSKRKLHHIMVILRPISFWYFAAIFLVSLSVGIYALRANNLKAIELRDKLLQVDKENGDVEAALRELREFTYGHMNARLASDTGIYPPIQLKYRYERLVQAEKERAAGGSENIYNDAQKYCEQKYPEGLSGSNRLPCIKDYVDSRTAAVKDVQEIPDSLYKFDFVSPVWSPDLAGWSLVVAGVSFLLFIVRMLGDWWLRSQLD
jgi:hypothetical protein